MFRSTLVTIAVAAALVAGGSAQSRRDSPRDPAASRPMSCDDRSYSDDRATHCELREDTIGGTNPIDVDAGHNGGIKVRGWDRGDVLVRSRIQASANTEADARRLVSAIRIDTGGGRIRADGPDTDRNESWSVSFELNVPRAAMLALRTNNGGIAIADFRGTATFRATNGGVTLSDVGGDLRGATTNGGVTIDVTGDHWDGAGLDVETRNGGIRMTLPKGFSAQLEAGTTHGGISVDFPVAVQGRVRNHLETTIGSGGPRLRAITTNGGVSIRQK